MEGRVAELTRQLASATSSLTSSFDQSLQMNELTTRISTLMNDKQSLVDDKQKIDEECKRVTELLTTHDATISSLRDQVTSLTSQLDNANGSKELASTHEAQLAQQSIDYSDLKSKAASLQHQLDSVNNDLQLSNSKSMSDLAEANTRYNDAIKQVSQLEVKLQQATKASTEQLTSITNEARQSREEVTVLEQQVESHETSLQDVKQQLVDMSNHRDQLQHSIATLTNDNEQLQARLAAVAIVATPSPSSVDASASENDEKALVNSNMNGNGNDDVYERIRQLEAKLAEESARNAHVERKRSSLQHRMDALRHKYRQALHAAGIAMTPRNNGNGNGNSDGDYNIAGISDDEISDEGSIPSTPTRSTAATTPSSTATLAMSSLSLSNGSGSNESLLPPSSSRLGQRSKERVLQLEHMVADLTKQLSNIKDRDGDTSSSTTDVSASLAEVKAQLERERNEWKVERASLEARHNEVESSGRHDRDQFAAEKDRLLSEAEEFGKEHIVYMRQREKDHAELVEQLRVEVTQHEADTAAQQAITSSSILERDTVKAQLVGIQKEIDELRAHDKASHSLHDEIAQLTQQLSAKQESLISLESSYNEAKQKWSQDRDALVVSHEAELTRQRQVAHDKAALSKATMLTFIEEREKAAHDELEISRKMYDDAKAIQSAIKDTQHATIVEKMKAKLVNIEDERDKLKATITDMEADREQQYGDLERAQELWNKEKASLESTISGHNEKVTSLTHQLEEAKRSLVEYSNAHDEHERLKLQLREVNDAADEAKSLAASEHAQVAELQVMFKSLESQLRDARESSATAQRLSNSDRDHIASLEQEKATLEANLKQSSIECNKVANQLAESDTIVQQLQRERELERARIKGESLRMDDTKATLNQQADSLQVTINQLTSTIGQLEEDNKSLRSRVTHAENEVATLGQSHNVVINQLAEEKKLRADAEDNRRIVQSESTKSSNNDTTAASLASTLGELGSLRASLTSSNAEVVAEKQRASIIEVKLGQLNKEYNDMTAKYEADASKIKELQEQVSNLRQVKHAQMDEIEELTEKLKAKSSTPSQSSISLGEAALLHNEKLKSTEERASMYEDKYRRLERRMLEIEEEHKSRERRYNELQDELKRATSLSAASSPISSPTFGGNTSPMSVSSSSGSLDLSGVARDQVLPTFVIRAVRDERAKWQRLRDEEKEVRDRQVAGLEKKLLEAAAEVKHARASSTGDGGIKGSNDPSTNIAPSFVLKSVREERQRMQRLLDASVADGKAKDAMITRLKAQPTMTGAGAAASAAQAIHDNRTLQERVNKLETQLKAAGITPSTPTQGIAISLASTPSTTPTSAVAATGETKMNRESLEQSIQSLIMDYQNKQPDDGPHIGKFLLVSLGDSVTRLLRFCCLFVTEPSAAELSSLRSQLITYHALLSSSPPSSVMLADCCACFNYHYPIGISLIPMCIGYPTVTSSHQF
jgi:chromosome segregation ATPase